LSDELLHRLNVPLRQTRRHRLNRFPVATQQQATHVYRTPMASLTTANRLQEIDEELLQPLSAPFHLGICHA
jgi:hypothetical protein